MSGLFLLHYTSSIDPQDGTKATFTDVLALLAMMEATYSYKYSLLVYVSKESNGVVYPNRSTSSKNLIALKAGKKVPIWPA
jgi:hypothetical protein